LDVENHEIVSAHATNTVDRLDEKQRAQSEGLLVMMGLSLLLTEVSRTRRSRSGPVSVEAIGDRNIAEWLDLLRCYLSVERMRAREESHKERLFAIAGYCSVAKKDHQILGHWQFV
jgi:hypothetical protein